MPTRSTAPAGEAAAPAPPTAPPGITSFPVPYPTLGSIEKLSPALDDLIDASAPIEKLAEGFRWSEGPLWAPALNAVLFSDVPANIIYAWTPSAGVAVFMSPSGFHGDHTDSKEPGANGLTLDRDGRLLMCQHGDRRVARLDDWQKPNGSQTPLATHYKGKRLNSPNDVVVHSSGAIFFTDPPYGLPKRGEPEPSKELEFSGVYRRDADGSVTLIHDGLERPNGIALSPDERTLYVANSHGPRPIWMAFDLDAKGNASKPRVFADARELPQTKGRAGGNDGIAVDERGNLFATGPGGVLILSPQGKHLGTILTTQPTANCKFGDDGRTLYITSNMNLLRVRTKTRGIDFARPR